MEERHHSPDIPFERDWLSKLVAAFAGQQDAGSGADGISTERAGELLWDLAADPAVAAALLDDALLDAVRLRLSSSDARTLELCFGILANLCSSPDFWRAGCSGPSYGVASQALQLFLLLEDPPALSEACRMLTAALATEEGASIWLPLLEQQQQQFLPQLLMIITNTLHSLLLQRSLQLVATLLQAEADAADATAEAADQQDPQQRQQQQLCQLSSALQRCGLIDALAAVLLPAATLRTDRLAAAGLPAAGTGGWSDDEPDEPHSSTAAAAGTDEGDSQAERLYAQPDVLLALLAVLQQLGQHPQLAVAAAQQLPVSLLLLLAAAAAAGEQQLVLEGLLPVLVMLRAGVLPLLLRPVQQLQQALAVQQQQQQQQEEEEEEGAVPTAPSAAAASSSSSGGAGDGAEAPPDLSLLLAVAVVLQDCGPDALDALDAGWFIVAAGSRQLCQQLATHQQQQADDGGSGSGSGSNGQRQQQADGGAAAGGSWMAGVCQQLPQLCAHLSRASIPASAAAYAREAALRLTAALEALCRQQQQQLQSSAAMLKQALLPHLQALAANVVAASPAGEQAGCHSQLQPDSDPLLAAVAHLVGVLSDVNA